MKPDKYQLKAIKEEGNILLIAGAGAGKTYTITEKIKYLIEKKNYKPYEILVISFTNKSVDDLKKKIKEKVNITTFHKLAISILDEYDINYELAPDHFLEDTIDNFFKNLTNKEFIKEILRYFRLYDYETFLQSKNYKELKKLICTLIKIFKTNNKKRDDFKKLFTIDTF